MTELPKGWAIARLADIAEVRLGRQRSPKRATGDRMRPYLRAANVKWTGLDLSDVKEMDFTERESDVYELRAGDLLLSEASGSPGEVGKPAQYRDEIDGCCFQNTLLRVRLPAVLSPDFYEHYFREQALTGRFAAGSRGVGIHHLGAAALSDWTIPVPPATEQGRVVAAIEEAFSKLAVGEAGLRTARQLLRRLRDAVIAAAFSRVSFSDECADLCDAVVDCPHSTAEFLPFGRPCVDTTCIEPGRVVRERLRYVSDATWNERVRRLVPRMGDVVFAREGTIGTAVALPGGLEPCLGQRVMILRPRVGIVPEFLEQALMTPQVRAQYEPQIAGSTAPHLNVRDVKRLLLPAPSVDVQRGIVAALTTQFSFIEACERAVDVGLVRAGALRRSVLKAAFEGRLAAQDPSDGPASILLERLGAERAVNGAAPRGRGRRRKVELT